MNHLRSPLGQVRGLGSAKDGTHHWWAQRLSAIALVPLGFCFAVVLVRLAKADHATVIAAFSSPLVALVAASTVIIGFWHLKLGLQVVIEDYVHDRAWEVLLQITQIFFCWVLGGLGVLAVLRLHLGM